MSESQQSKQIIINGESRSTTSKTLGDLLNELSIERVGTAVEVNQEIVPKATLDSVEVKSGDHIEVVRLVGGG